MQKTNFPYEIIIHDDASTDGTRELLKEYQKKYPGKIRLLLENENQWSKGKRVLLELCLPEAKGKYVAVSDGDDEWTYDGKLQEQYDFMEQNPDVSLCLHNAVCKNMLTDEKTNLITDMESRFLDDEEIMTGKHGWEPTTSFFFRSEYIPDIPEFSYRAPVGDDPLKFYYACKGKVYYMDKVWALRNLFREGSWSYSMQDKAMELAYTKKYLIYLDEFNHYSRGRFDCYIQERIYAMCLCGVDLLLGSRPLESSLLSDVMEEFGKDTESRFGPVLDEIFREKQKQCLDYLGEKTQAFISQCMKMNGKLYLYGTGEIANKISQKLKYQNIPYAGFVVSEGHKKNFTYEGHNVLEISELDNNRTEIFLWLCMNEENTGQVLPVVKSYGYQHILTEN